MGSTPATPDLRRRGCADALDRAETALSTELDRSRLLIKRRSVSAPSGRGTWVRIEVRAESKLFGQGFNGMEAAAGLIGVAKPAWLAGVVWRSGEPGLVWRADEMELVSDPAIAVGAMVRAMPQLPTQWWSTFGTSLDALGRAPTTRIATLHTLPISARHPDLLSP